MNYQQNTTTLWSEKLTIGPVFVTLTLKPFLPTQVLIRFSGHPDTSVFVNKQEVTKFKVGNKFIFEKIFNYYVFVFLIYILQILLKI